MLFFLIIFGTQDFSLQRYKKNPNIQQFSEKKVEKN